MDSLRFNITIRGGSADDSRVDASAVATILEGVAKDIREVGFNIEPSLSAQEIRRSCKVFVTGRPKAGCLAMPCAVEQANIAQTYFSGIEVMANGWDVGRAELPRGFNQGIVKRVRGYYDVLEPEGQELSFDVEANGAPPRSVELSPGLKTALSLALVRLEEREAAVLQQVPKPTLVEHSIQGVLYELKDENYNQADGKVTFEVDTRDGDKWQCESKRGLIPDTLADHHLQTVLVEGTATMMQRGPHKLSVKSFRTLGDVDPLEALESLRELFPDLMEGETSEELVARLRSPED